MNKKTLEDINDEIQSLAYSLGYAGKTNVSLVDFSGAQNTGHGACACSVNGVTISVPAQLDEDAALKEAKIQLIHGISHDQRFTRSGIDASHPVEEAMTYIRGRNTASQLGLSKEYEEMGREYVAQDLASAVDDAKGEEHSPETLARAKLFVAKKGINGSIAKLKTLVPYGMYPLGYEGEKNKLMFRKAGKMVIPAMKATGAIFLAKGLMRGGKKKKKKNKGGEGIQGVAKATKVKPEPRYRL